MLGSGTAVLMFNFTIVFGVKVSPVQSTWIWAAVKLTLLEEKLEMFVDASIATDENTFPNDTRLTAIPFRMVGSNEIRVGPGPGCAVVECDRVCIRQDGEIRDTTSCKDSAVAGSGPGSMVGRSGEVCAAIGIVLPGQCRPTQRRSRRNCDCKQKQDPNEHSPRAHRAPPVARAFYTESGRLRALLARKRQRGTSATLTVNAFTAPDAAGRGNANRRADLLPGGDTAGDRLCHVRRLLISLLLFLAPLQALATGDRSLLGFFAIQIMCTYQDPSSYPASSDAPRFQNMKSAANKAVSECFQARKWIPAEICNEVMHISTELSENPKEEEAERFNRDLQLFFRKHAQEIERLQRAADYMMSARESTDPMSVACPTDIVVALPPIQFLGEEESRNSDACNAITREDFGKLTGMQITSAQAAAEDDYGARCFLHVNGGEPFVVAKRNEIRGRMPLVEAPVRCADAAEQPYFSKDGTGLACVGGKYGWSFRVFRTDSTLDAAKLEAVTRHIVEHIPPREVPEDAIKIKP